jgi:hypothetical protein
MITGGNLAAAANIVASRRLMNEAALKLLETSKTIVEFRSFAARNRQRAEAQGLKESDLPRMIAETRAARHR